MEPSLSQTSKQKFTRKIFSLLCSAILFVICSNETFAIPKVDLQSTIQSLSTKIAGLAPDEWDMYDRVKIFTAENLYEHINGRAELYLAYNIKSLTTATFENPSERTEFIELSIYDMDSSTNAFGIFSVERSQDEAALDLGRQSYSSGSSIFIWKGKYYTTIVTSSTSDKLLQLCLGIAREVAAFLEDSGEPVWGLSALPQKNRVPHSVKYFKVDALGLDFMQNTYTAKYRKNDAEITVFLSHQDSSDSARDTVARYSEYATQYGNGSQSLTKDGMTFILCDMGDSFDVIFQKGQLVGGVHSVDKQSTALEAAAELWEQIQPE
ncbi:MAG: hypothetical protein PVF22_02865 [Candidatus Aminicenantes bacterium]|jgi:hypothetical protein